MSCTEINVNVTTGTSINVDFTTGAPGQNASILPQNFSGTALSGTSGQANRELTVSGVPLLVDVDNSMLHPTSQYTVNGSTITFLNKTFDSQKITIWN